MLRLWSPFPVVEPPGAEPSERELTRAVPEAVVPSLDRLVPAPESVVVAPEPVVMEPCCPPGGWVVDVVGPGGPVVSVEVLELVGGSVLLVGGAVVGGTVLALVVVPCRAWVVEGASPAEVVERLVRGTITACRERVVVVSPVAVAGETCWRCGRVVVVVEMASAACLGEVAKPTMLPPIAPISIAATTLTHRRAAT